MHRLDNTHCLTTACKRHVRGQVFLRHGRNRAMLNALSRPRSARPCCVFVAYDFQHRVGNLLRVVGIDKSCRGIVENLSMSRDVGYEHRTVACHRFEDRIGTAFVLAKKRKDSCCFHQAPHAVLRDLSEKPDLVRDAALPREHLQAIPLRPIAAQDR